MSVFEGINSEYLCTSLIQVGPFVLPGAFIPRCNEEGYYKATQCHGSTGQCWCVDKYGNELAGSRKQGAVSCGE